MRFISDGTNRFAQIVDSEAYFEDVEAILGEKIKGKTAMDITNYMIENNYIKKLDIANINLLENGDLEFDNKPLIDSLNELFKNKNIDLSLDKRTIPNVISKLFKAFDSIDKKIKQYGYKILILTAGQGSFITIVKEYEKKYQYTKFEIYGFVEKEDKNKSIIVNYKGIETTFNYKTNVENIIPDTDLKIMLVEEVNGFKSFFINTEKVKNDVGSSFKANYSGLWDDLKLVCIFNKALIFKGIINEKNELEVKIV